MKKIALFNLLMFVAGIVAAASPVDALRSYSASLYNLYITNAAKQQVLAEYATRQGFRRPYENVATVVHEMIHLTSAAHAGYFIDGVYYEPYLATEAWPSLRNIDVLPHMTPNEQGVIYTNYMRVTPNNNLGNILDEVNAYSHVLGFVCAYEPQSCRRQADNLLGHLQVVEAYLRMTRTMRPAEYAALAKNRLSSGAITTITARAWGALQSCGLPADQLPRQEAAYFVGLPR